MVAGIRTEKVIADHNQRRCIVSQDQFTQQDPTEQHAAPGSGDRTVVYPGRTGDMDVQPDHGEHSYRGTGRLEGKKAIITGGDSGIGRAVAIAFAREGGDVLITCLESEQDDARETARWVVDAGRRAVTVASDLREEQHCREVIDRTIQEFGQIDVLVSNAAYQMSQDGGLDGVTTEQFDRVMKTNVFHHHHQFFGPGVSAVPAPDGLRGFQGRNRELH